MANGYSNLAELGQYGFGYDPPNYYGSKQPEQGLALMWWRKKEAEKVAEATRKDRGELARKLVELDRERTQLERLMAGMLEKRGHKDA